jgi:hypothetical protein
MNGQWCTYFFHETGSHNVLKNNGAATVNAVENLCRLSILIVTYVPTQADTPMRALLICERARVCVRTRGYL